MRLILLCACIVFAGRVCAQTCGKTGKKLQKDTLTNLQEVVVTGQYEARSLKNSVYHTRIISSEQIKLRAATNLQQVLGTELGFRFSNDLTLATSDVQLMGMTGRNVKILLDGVPMIDRSDTRESLNQIDINTIERIEIVEGPMSVSYGTDALAGVINVITKKSGKQNTNLNARIQEETVGHEYLPFSRKGMHTQHIGAGWQNERWSGTGGLTHNDFNGFKSAGALATAIEIAADNNRWKPKEQWLTNAKLGYNSAGFNVGYRLDYADETIVSKGGYNPGNYKATNQKYIINRCTQALQGDYLFSEKIKVSGSFAFSNLKRSTQTVIHDYTTGLEILSTGLGEQDISKFQSTNLRSTVQYKLSDRVSFQPGVEVNLDGASGARIKGDPSINDYAFFISSEVHLTQRIVIRPGIRFISNSVYDAPPAIPSFNAKIALNKDLDLRFGYASGFRSPALRELYYDFFDASHSIMGNPNLKAEQSNSFTGSLSYNKIPVTGPKFTTILSSFYNNFKNRIDYGLSVENPTITTLINISRYKTIGGTFNNTLAWKDLQISLGLYLVGINNRYDENKVKPGESNKFSWSPEINSNVTYTFPKLATTVNLAYKFNGTKPFYVLHEGEIEGQVSLEKTGAYNTADLIVSKYLFKLFTLNTGIKNIFDVQTVSSTAIVTNAAHSTGGPVPMNYGRSYVVGLSFNLNK